MFEYFKNIISILTVKQKKESLILFFLILIHSIVETFGIGLVFPALIMILDENAMNNYSFINDIYLFFNFTEYSSLVNLLILTVFVFFIIRFSFIIFFAWFQNKFIFTTNAELSHRLLKRYLFAPWNFVLKSNSGEMIRTIDSDVSIYSRLSLLSLFNFFKDILLVLSIIALLSFFNLKLTLFSIIFFAVFSASIYLFLRNKIYNLGRDRHLTDSKKTKELIQTLSAIKDIRVLGLEKIFVKLYDLINFRSARIWRNQNFVNEIPRNFLELFTIFFVIIILYIFYHFYDQSYQVFLPILGVFGASAIRLVPATGRILSNLQNLKFSKVSTLAISKNLDDYRVEEKKNKDKILEFSFKKEIVFENITFKHENKSENILENIDLKISKGETIGIIGESGSGKSTLIDILLGLNSTSTGSVLVDNLNINENIVGWRKNIGYVSQNLFLIDDSIEKNITFLFNNEPYVQEKLNKVIKDVQLNRFIEKLPKGIKTEVGERGLRISGGEKQRIVIARILFNNPDVLIFDESTNALDLETEKKIIDLIHDLKSKNKTIIFVSHRKSTLEKCDSIYLLKDKKLELKK